MWKPSLEAAPGDIVLSDPTQIGPQGASRMCMLVGVGCAGRCTSPSMLILPHTAFHTPYGLMF